ncbi:MAG: hypothetical protein P8H31_10390 [Porticoccaceae bacterium]|nr:hypothetical protein [Porticoccaceae bacterium]
MPFHQGWSFRKRAIHSSGILVTAGELLFYGSRDRVFSAHDIADGTELWRVRLNGVPSGAPISFMIDGKQYIAVSSGENNPGGQFKFAEQNRNPRNTAATIWVFELE